MNFKEKYLKYKQKYIKLKKYQLGGEGFDEEDDDNEKEKNEEDDKYKDTIEKIIDNTTMTKINFGTINRDDNNKILFITKVVNILNDLKINDYKDFDLFIKYLEENYKMLMNELINTLRNYKKYENLKDQIPDEIWDGLKKYNSIIKNNDKKQQQLTPKLKSTQCNFLNTHLENLNNIPNDSEYDEIIRLFNKTNESIKFLSLDNINECIKNKYPDFVPPSTQESQSAQQSQPFPPPQQSTQSQQQSQPEEQKQQQSPPPQPPPVPINCVSKAHKPIECTDKSHYREQTEYFKNENNKKCPNDANCKLKELKKLCPTHVKLNFSDDVETHEIERVPDDEKSEVFSSREEEKFYKNNMYNKESYGTEFLEKEITSNRETITLLNIFYSLNKNINKSINNKDKQFWLDVLNKFQETNDIYVKELMGGFKKKKYQTGGTKEEVINDFVKYLQDNNITIENNELIRKPLEALKSSTIPPPPPELPTRQQRPSPPELPVTQPQYKQQSKPEQEQCKILNRYLEKLGHEPTKEEYYLIMKEYDIENPITKLSIEQINKCIKEKYPDFIIPPPSPKTKPMKPILFSNINIISSDTENTVKSNVSLGGNEIPYVSFPLMTINEFKKNPYYKPLIKH